MQLFVQFARLYVYTVKSMSKLFFICNTIVKLGNKYYAPSLYGLCYNKSRYINTETIMPGFVSIVGH